ncbi:unnamed protein product [Arctia plantaginis]|uniref:Uncharacterized protein n=1 Tax=Arctia plantaginis TaxID=874455 RepID=A0A8S1A036_ARCPL|nr:unnamed protein product [Arctia plantaginis]
MADDLRNYKLQLQQVEAALLTDAQNEELLKLKADLEEHPCWRRRMTKLHRSTYQAGKLVKGAWQNGEQMGNFMKLSLKMLEKKT